MVEWINKLWDLHTIEYHSAIKRKQTITHLETFMDLWGIILSKKASTKRLHTISFHLYNIPKMTGGTEKWWVILFKIENWKSRKYASRPVAAPFPSSWLNSSVFAMTMFSWTQEYGKMSWNLMRTLRKEKDGAWNPNSWFD